MKSFATRRPSRLTGKRDSNIKTPRKNDSHFSERDSDFESSSNLSLSLPSSPSSSSSPTVSTPSSDFPLITKLFTTQLRNESFEFFEELLLWKSEYEEKQDDDAGTVKLKRMRRLLMKNIKNRSKLSILIGEHLEKDPETEKNKQSGEVSKKGIELWRANIWDFMDNPNSSNAAYVTYISVLVIILISCTAFCLETVNSLDHLSNIFHFIEVFSVVCFTIEYVIRLLCAPEIFPFIRGPLNIIDVLSILPFYIELLGKGVGLSSTQVCF